MATANAEKEARAGHQFMVDKTEVGSRIRALRQAKDMTQGELARLVGKSRPAIAQWENGEALPPLGDIEALAFYLGSQAQFIAFGVTSSNSDSFGVPVMDFTLPEGVRVGEMSLDMDFYRSLHRQPSAMLRAFKLPRNDMMDGLERGAVAIIDMADRQIIGAGEAFLIHHKVPAIAYVNSVPGKDNAYALRIGGQHIQTDGNIPVLGRIVAVLRAHI